jgi:hypothetical protein
MRHGCASLREPADLFDGGCDCVEEPLAEARSLPSYLRAAFSIS